MESTNCDNYKDNYLLRIYHLQVSGNSNQKQLLVALRSYQNNLYLMRNVLHSLLLHVVATDVQAVPGMAFFDVSICTVPTLDLAHYPEY